MNLQRLIQKYLTYQRSLGWRPPSHGGHLGKFGRFIGARADIADVRPKQVQAFLAGDGPITRTWHVKYGILRPFYRYAMSRGYVAVSPLPTVVPQRSSTFVPYIYSHEDLRRLLQAIDTIHRPNSCVEPVTMRTIFLLLYGAGLRRQEALNLEPADVDWKGSLLTIRHTKFLKTRLVPFGPQLGSVLAAYTRTQERKIAGPLFTTKTGARIDPQVIQHYFRFVCKRANVFRTDSVRFQPRLHDLRHTFAVHRLTSWYQQGADVQKLLPQLSTYLGHVSIEHTQVYLTMTPELLREAGNRFDQYARQEAHHE